MWRAEKHEMSHTFEQVPVYLLPVSRYDEALFDDDASKAMSNQEQRSRFGLCSDSFVLQRIEHCFRKAERSRRIGFREDAGIIAKCHDPRNVRRLGLAKVVGEQIAWPATTITSPCLVGVTTKTMNKDKTDRI